MISWIKIAIQNRYFSSCTDIQISAKLLLWGHGYSSSPLTNSQSTLHTTQEEPLRGVKRNTSTMGIKHGHTFQRLCSWGIWWATLAVNNYLRCYTAMPLPMDSLASLSPLLPLALALSLSVSLILSASLTPSNASLFAFLSFFAAYKRFLSLASVCN